MTTMMMTYIQRPSLRDCSLVAKALIKEYEFLKDSEGDGEVRKVFLLPPPQLTSKSVF